MGELLERLPQPADRGLQLHTKLLGVGLDTADPAVTNLTAYYGVHHMLVKGALFLGVGVLAVTGGRRLQLVLLLMAVLALSLGGMPLTSGALAKLATKPMLGYGLLGDAMALAGAGSTMLMVHFLLIIRRDTRENQGSLPPSGQLVPWLIVTAASLAAATSSHEPMNASSTLTAGLTALAPASNARNVPTAEGISTPPTIPTVPDLVMPPATMPAR